ncbi:hypothetical protein [Rubripirellula obstinata]|uniref:hypothetical protein n=1 Tax=Rubripirellula obstinata TaxID=406547 RepID=UPI0012FB47CD|nr:hypothetical protein [Rubripirellula obstinata]
MIVTQVDEARADEPHRNGVLRITIACTGVAAAHFSLCLHVKSRHLGDAYRYPTEMPMTLIGDKRSFAFETSPCDEHAPDEFLTVDIFVADKLLTILDNAAYVPQFCGDIDAEQNHRRHDLTWLQRRDDLTGMDLTQAHLYLTKTEHWSQFLNWGPTTDDISCHLIIFRESLWITAFLYSENPDYDTNDPVVHGCKVSPFDLISILQSQSALMRKTADNHRMHRSGGG